MGDTALVFLAPATKPEIRKGDGVWRAYYRVGGALHVSPGLPCHQSAVWWLAAMYREGIVDR